MDTNKKTDADIIAEVAREYLWEVPSIRSLLLPTIVTMALSRYLAVHVSDMYRGISKALENNEGIGLSLFKYAMIYILGVFLTEIQSLVICKAGQMAYRRANKKAYRFFLELDLPSFRRFGKGEIQNIINRRSQAVQDIIDVFTLNFIPCAFTVFFVSLKVVKNIGFIPMIIILFCIIFYTVSTIKITAWRNKIRQKINRLSNKTSNIQVDGLMNYETILTYDNTEYEVSRYDKSLIELELNNTRLTRSMYILNLAQMGIWCIQSIIIVTISTLGIFVEKIKAEDLTFFVGVVAILVKSLDNLGFMYGKYKQAMLNMRLDVTHTVAKRTEGSIELSRFEHGLSVRNLSITIGDRTIFQNVNFSIMKGEKVAIIGKNGAGKSTLIKTLLSLQKPTSGMVLVDGWNINELKASSLRSIMTYVPQNPTMFDESVLYNVQYASHKMSEEDVIRLAKELGIHETIMRLESGYNTNVSEQGSALSGGERQKIAIMRALAAGGSILIMDEPTASLDKNAESDILRNITALQDVTVISIVHNLDLLKLFNRVLVVSDKTVKEGAHDMNIDLGRWEGCVSE